MFYRMAPISVTLNNLEGNLPIAILQLTACSRGPSEGAEHLVEPVGQK